MFKLISSDERDYTSHKNIAHDSFIILIWKKDLVVMLKTCTGPKWQGQATGTWFRNQTDTHLEPTDVSRWWNSKAGGGSKTHSRTNSYPGPVKELIPPWHEEWSVLWWSHVGIFQPPVETPGGFLFCIFFYTYIYFFCKSRCKTNIQDWSQSSGASFSGAREETLAWITMHSSSAGMTRGSPHPHQSPDSGIAQDFWEHKVSLASSLVTP